MNRTIPMLEPADIAEIATIEQATSYYQRVQGSYFRGVPGVGLTVESFDRMRPLFDAFHAAAPADFAQLWILRKADGAMLIATHLHSPSPGRALADYLAQQPLCDLAQRFASRWERIAEYYGALRCLYLLSEAPELDGELPEASAR